MKESDLVKILKDIPILLATSNDVNSNMAAVCDEIKSKLGLEYVAIYYLSEESAYLKYPEKDEYFKDFALGENLIEKLETYDEYEIFADDVGFQGSKVLKLFPLKIRETVFGFICVTHESLSDIKIAALKAFASVAAYSIKDCELSNVFKIQLKTLQAGIQDKTIAVKTIKEQNERILEADKAKNEFIANISHELRTPLNAIIGFSEVLSSQIFGPLNEKQAEYINDIYTSGVHLLGMINEILDISKLESNAMSVNYSVFYPKTAMEEVVNVMKPLADKKQLSVSCNCSFEDKVSLDYQKLQQILYNLLSNAIKFTPQNGKIEIQAAKLDKNLVISVQDSGVGVDPKAQEKIFDKFVQLENTYTKTGSSTGLGLTITKRFVEMMNGKIKIESTPGEGATFIITLPVEPLNA